MEFNGNMPSEKGAYYDKLCGHLSPSVVKAVESCALPHWSDDALARSIIDKLMDLSENTSTVLASLKALPFVYPCEADGWRFAPEIRSHFVERLKSRSAEYHVLNEFLVDNFERTLHATRDKDSFEARELEWRIAYHQAPINAEKALNRLYRLLEYAVENNRSSDIKAIVDLLQEQSPYFLDYQFDVRYFRSCYYNEQGDIQSAESHLMDIWSHASQGKTKALSGHLLSVIWIRYETQIDWQDRARNTLESSRKIFEELGDVRGQGKTLISLINVCIKKASIEWLYQANGFVRCILELCEQPGGSRFFDALLDLVIKEFPENSEEMIIRMIENLEKKGYTMGVPYVPDSLKDYESDIATIQGPGINIVSEHRVLCALLQARQYTDAYWDDRTSMADTDEVYKLAQALLVIGDRN